MRDDAEQLTPAQQERIFRDLLEAAFEHTAVDGFIMWGFWDPGHWRGNGPLFDEFWNVKAEAAPWFDLVHGERVNKLPLSIIAATASLYTRCLVLPVSRVFVSLWSCFAYDLKYAALFS